MNPRDQPGVQRLPLDSISIQHLDDYLDALDRVEQCPYRYDEAADTEPVDVLLARGVYWLQDGHNRFVTAQVRGDGDILVDLTINDFLIPTTEWDQPAVLTKHDAARLEKLAIDSIPIPRRLGPCRAGYDVDPADQQWTADMEDRALLYRIKRQAKQAAGANVIRYRQRQYIRLRTALYQTQRKVRQTLNRFSSGRLSNQMKLAPKQQDVWTWSDDIVSSTREGNRPDKFSWHPLTGEVVLTYQDNHADDINRYGTGLDAEYLRFYARRNGQIQTSPWNPLYDDLDYYELEEFAANIQQGCYICAEHFKDLLEPLLPDGYDVDLQGCSTKY